MVKEEFFIDPQNLNVQDDTLDSLLCERDRVSFDGEFADNAAIEKLLLGNLIFSQRFKFSFWKRKMFGLRLTSMCEIQRQGFIESLVQKE